MTFESREISRTLGEPINLYRFSLGDTVYPYTDAEQAVAFNGDIYNPIPIDRAPLSASGSLDKAALTVSMPQETEVAELYRVYPPTDAVSLVIFQGHHAESEFLVIWSGRVLSCARDGHEAELTCEPVSTSMRRPGLRRHYQYGCPHALYGPQCGANRAARTVTVNIVSVSGTSVNLTSGWEGAFTRAKFLGGILQWTNSAGRTELMTIIKVQETSVQLGGTPQTLDAGAEVEISAGCNHQLDDCQTLHENIVNFGGQPWIPLKSPLGQVNNYY